MRYLSGSGLGLGVPPWILPWVLSVKRVLGVLISACLVKRSLGY